MNNIAIFASGSGTNAENIIRFFRPNQNIQVQLVLTNKPDAKVVRRAQNLGIQTLVFNREEFTAGEKIMAKLKEHDISFIVLAGFLWLVPPYLLQAFPDKIINIHPALLPKYGGKGMYGDRVHQSVLANGEKETGISIHYVNEKYDEGNIIFQARCPVIPGDTAEMVASKVHQLEYEHFPRVIEEVIEKGWVDV